MLLLIFHISAHGGTSRLPVSIFISSPAGVLARPVFGILTR